MRRLLTGCFVTLLLLLNTLILFGPLMLFALLKLISPGRLRDYNSWAVMWIAETWSEIDKRIFALCLPTRWDIRGADNLSRTTSYLVISNQVRRQPVSVAGLSWGAVSGRMRCIVPHRPEAREWGLSRTP